MPLITHIRRDRLPRSTVFRLLAFRAYQPRPGIEQRFVIVRAIPYAEAAA